MSIRLASGEVVASELRWARSARDRTRGLIGVRSMPPGEALVLTPAHQVHTFGMAFPLDVVFCDREWKVLHVVRSMPPRRMSRFVWRSRYVIELGGGSLPANLTAGESLTVVA